MSDAIESLTLPKWGLSMTRGTLVEWLVKEGDAIAVGDEVAEVETDKMTAAVEAQVAGTLRRQVAQPGEIVSVGGVLGVIAAPEVGEDEIQTFVEQATGDDVVDAQAAAGPSSETVDTAIGPINVLRAGDGERTVVLLHGFGGDVLNWRFNIEELSRSSTVIAIDLPGHGGSTKDVGDASLDALVATVSEVLDALDVASAHVVGHSLGGLVGAELTIQAPERVASLALIAPAGFGAEINAEFIDGFVSANSRREVKTVLRVLFADEATVTRPLTEDVLKYKRLEGVPEALAALRDTLFPAGQQTTQVASELASLTLPVLVIWGDADRVLASGHENDLAGTARVEVIASIGHSPHVEAAAEVNQLLLELIEAA